MLPESVGIATGEMIPCLITLPVFRIIGVFVLPVPVLQMGPLTSQPANGEHLLSSHFHTFFMETPLIGVPWMGWFQMRGNIKLLSI